MKCFNCQYENPDGAKFCQNCGASQMVTCPNCATQLSPGARFCVNCGTAQADPSHQQKDARKQNLNEVENSTSASAPVVMQTGPLVPAPGSDLERLIPKELLSKLEAARVNRSMAGERRIVTVLFCDVKGSTAMAETLDPEEWAEIMNGAFKYLIEPVYKYEGTLARLMGDAILAFFGAPIAHEDDPQRAVLAGLDIVESIKPYRQEIKRRYDLELNLRVGINTGLVVVGEVGSDLRVEYTAMGDAVNVASRMEQTAEPGTVQISDNTYKSVSNLFEFESLGLMEVKGKSEPVASYRAIKARAGAVPTRGIEGLSSPLVGRDRELQTLQSKMDDLLMGRGGVASLIGEAGLGKSRLVTELRKWLVTQGLWDEIGSSIRSGQKLDEVGDEGRKKIQWHEGRSLSYETNTPYAPFVGILSSCFGLSEDDGNDVKIAKLERLVGELMPGQEAEFVPFIAAMLGVPLSGDYADRVRYLEPMALRGRIFQAVPALLGAMSSMNAEQPWPLVLMFEDLHWVDPTSLELLTQLLPLTESAPLMILTLFRPNTQDPSWGFHEQVAREYAHSYTQVPLSPLGENDSRQLVANLLEIEDLPEKVRALILAKAEGNPFFVEEVIRSLLDAKLVVREGDHWRATREIENIAVPDTLAGVITARLDRLDDASKQAAQTAAVVGREFGYDVLEAVYDAPQALGEAVTTLQRRELVRERSRLPRRVYLFKHVLTQETAYSSLLLSKRRELHGRVAECLERMEDESASEIARHFLEARQEDRALPYLVEAGERAARAGARTEAIGFFKKAVDIVQTVEDLGAARRAYEGLGKVLEFSMDGQGAFETYHNMLHYAQEHSDIPMQVSALNKMSFLHALVMGQFPEAESHLAEAEGLASEHQDSDGLYELYNLKCMMCMMAADFSNADRYLTEAVELGRRTNRLDNLAYGLAHKSNTLAMMTRFDESWEIAQEALRVAEQAGNLQFKANALGESVTVHFMSKGELDEAYARGKEGYEIAQRIGATIEMTTPTFFLVEIAALKGDYELALQWAERGEKLGRMLVDALPFALAIVLGTKGLVYQEIGTGLSDRAIEAHEEALKLMHHPAGATAGGSCWPDMGFTVLARGDAATAAQYFENGLTTPSIVMHLQRPRTLCGAALAALAQGRVEEGDYIIKAAQYADEARQFAQERTMKNTIPLIEFTQGRVQQAKGDCEGALAHYTEAEKLGMEMGMRPIVWQARAAAANALTLLGRLPEAEQKLAEAQAMVEEIASLFKNEEYRRMFVESAKAGSGTIVA